PEDASLAKGAVGLFPSPALSECCHRSLARRLIAVGRALDVAVMAARPHPRAALRRNRHQKDAADNHVVLHVIVVVAQLGYRGRALRHARNRGGLSNRQCCYGRSSSISALSAASIVRYEASTAITRGPASAIQPVWPTSSISAHCSESSRAPRIELVPLIICAARRILGTSARAAASRSAERTDGV